MEDGTIIEPKYNFDEIVATDAVITDVGMQEIVVSQDEVKPFINGVELKTGEEIRKVKRIRLLLFLAFKNKITIIRYIYYPDDFYVNAWLGG